MADSFMTCYNFTELSHLIMDTETNPENTPDNVAKSDIFGLRKLLKGKSISEALYEETNLPANITYTKGPKGGVILTDKNTGRKWYASDEEKQRYNLPQNQQSAKRALKKGTWP